MVASQLIESQEEAKLNQQLGRLLDPKALDRAKLAGDAERRAATSSEIERMRDDAKHDLYYLAKFVLGYRDLSKNLHGHLCSWLLRNEAAQFRCILLPRSHFKSTIITIALNVLRLLRDPNARVLIAHESHTGAQRFLYEITSHFLGNPKLMALFPELIPDQKLQRINVKELELPRDAHWAEPSFDTIGVGGRAQGRHYNFINLDDIFGDKARDSKVESDRLKQWFDNIQAFLISLAIDKMDLVGTRYSLDDIYGHAFDRYGDQMLKYIRRVEEVNEETGQLVPIFPERFTTKSLEILRRNPVVFHAQYENDPVAGLTEFQTEWLRFYEWGPEKRIVIFLGDERKIIHLQDCDIIFLIDPARESGKTAIVVTAMDQDSRVFILDAIKGEYSDPEFMNLLFSLAIKWFPRAVVIEEVLFSGLYKPWIESEMKTRNVRFIVQAATRRRIGRQYEAKNDHIKALAPFFAAQQIFAHLGLTNFVDEYHKFGATQDVHLLDALAYGPEHWVPGTPKWKMDQIRETEKRMMENRDVHTGYSSIYDE